MDILWKLFIEKIEDSKGVKRDALTPLGKVMVPVLLLVIAAGTNGLQYFTIDKEITEVQVLDQEGIKEVVNQTFDTKIMEKKLHDQKVEMEERIQSVKEHANRDMRITTTERTLVKQEDRLEEMENNYIMQQQVLLEIREKITGDSP